MTNKRGQLTIFIILAVLIVAVVAMVFVFMRSDDQDSSGVVDVKPVVDIVEGCLEESSKEALYFVGLNNFKVIPSSSRLTISASTWSKT